MQKMEAVKIRSANAAASIVILLFILSGCTFLYIENPYPNEKTTNIQPALLKNLKADPEKYLPLLVYELIDGLNDDSDKIRNIHDWITLNISYDIGAYLHKIQPDDNPISVIKNSTALCSGYARLFKKMCYLAGIECHIIDGYVLSSEFIEAPLSSVLTIPNHQWNAVKSEGKWYFTDLTFDSGFIVNNIFEKKYNTEYFMVEPSIFIKSHFPILPNWQLTANSVSWEEFIQFHKVK